MMNILKTVFALSMLLTFLQGCSTATERCDSVNQDRIYQSYSVTYDEAQNQTSANAQFRFGDGSGTTLELVGKCGVTHDVYSLAMIRIFGTSYYGSGSSLKNSHSFSFTDSNGKIYANSGSIASIAFSGLPGSFSKASDLTINWSGGALASGETVYVYISSDSVTGELASASTSAVGGTSITIPKSKYSNWTSGEKRIRIERVKSSSLQEAASAGGSFTGTYQTSKQSIQLTD